MNSIIIYSLLASFIVSIISFIGVFTLSLSKKLLNLGVFIFVGLATGALLGDVFFHLLPELIEEQGYNLTIAIWILVGIFVFFLLEKLFIWHHHHAIETPNDHQNDNCQEVHSNCHIGYMNLIGDGIHNFIDGLLIASSFMISPIVGFSTTIAIILHEIPQEIGDFGVLIHSGMSIKKALSFNFLTALLSLLGAIIALIFGTSLQGFTSVLIPITVGSFLYIAASDLIPELKKQDDLKQTITQSFAIIIGMAIMFGLTFSEGHNHDDDHEIDHHEDEHIVYQLNS